MTSKTKITVDLKVGDNDTMRVDAYESSTPGLALHRQVAYVPAKEEHKFTSKWQITQISTGAGLLRPSECLDTMARAESVAKKVSGHDWTEKLERDSPAHRDLLEALATAEPASEEGDAVEIRRYVVRRNSNGPGYVVWDTEGDVETEVHMHRGLAGEAAKSLNEKVST